MPSPYGTQRAVSTSAAALCKNSWARRDLPTPAGPLTVTSRHIRSFATLSSSVSSSESSRARPTSGTSTRRGNAVAPATVARTRHAATGARFLFAATLGTASSSAAWATSLRVAAPMRISPRAAASSRRFAVLTASPVTSVVVMSPVTTSPVFTPMRTCTSSMAAASRMSTAARTARKASSS